MAVLEDPTNVHTIPNGERLLTILNKSSPLVVARVSPRKIWFASIPGSETPPLKNGGDFFSLNHDPLSYTNGKTRKENMSDLRIKPNKDNGDLPKKLSIKKCSCCYHPPTKEYPKKFVKNNPDLFPEFNKKKE